MLSKVGFFHFGEKGHKDPIGSLRSKLCESTKDRLAESLIVLPEAFNFPGDYWDSNNKAQLVPNVKDALEKIALHFNVAFVVGLIDSDARSSAYLIDGHDRPKLICCKVANDKLGRYKPCTDNDAATNPVPYKGSCVAALICNDASNGRDRRRALMERMDALASTSRILCIPACDTTTPRDQFLQDSRSKTLVMANSYPYNCGSFIMRNGLTLKSCNDEANRICLVGVEIQLAA